MTGQYPVIFIALSIHAGCILFASWWIQASPVVLMLGSLKVAMARGELTAGYLDVFSLFHQLGMPSSFLPLLFSMVLIVVVTSMLWRYQPNDTLLVLSILSMLSLVATPHKLHDSIVLIFPLYYLLRQKSKDPFSILCAVSIFFIWYLKGILALLPASEILRYALRVGDDGVIIMVYGWLGYAVFQVRKTPIAVASN